MQHPARSRQPGNPAISYHPLVRPAIIIFVLSLAVQAQAQWEHRRLPHHRQSARHRQRQKLWITVGPHGTDISRDDGRNWTSLKPTKGEPADADKNWNALSLPFVVGPNGRIGKLRPTALKP